MPTSSAIHSDGRITQMFTALERYLYDRIPDGMTTNSTVLRVDKSGDDLTAVRGEIHKPYLTIQAAVTASQSGDTILIGPGTYAENIVIPAARTSLTIAGSGSTQTLVSPAAGVAFSWTAAAAVMSSLTFRDLIIATAVGQNNITIIATAQPTSFQQGLVFDNVIGTTSGAAVSIALTNVNNVSIRDCQLAGSSFAGVSQINAWNTLFQGGVLLNYNEAVHVASGGCLIKRFYKCRITGTLGVLTHENARFDKECMVVGNITVTLVDNGATNNSFEFHGEAQSSMTLSHDIAAPRLVFDCDECFLSGAAAVLNCLSPGAVGPSRFNASFRKAVISTAATPGIVTGAYCDLDLIGATFDHTVAVLQFAGAPNGGTCNRSVFRSTVVGGLAAGANALTFAASFGPVAGPAVLTIPDFTDANYSVNVEQTIAANDPLVTPKALTGFTVTEGGAGDADAVVTVIHD